MNSKTIFKRTLPLIIALVVVIITAVSCTLLTKDKSNPKISNGNDTFLSAGSIVIKNDEVYNRLKNSVGVDTFVEKFDTELLKDVDGVNYLTSVTDKEIYEAMVKSIFATEADWDINIYDALVAYLYGSDATVTEKAELKDTMFGTEDIPGTVDTEAKDEADKKITEWKRSMLLSYGCRTFADIKEYNRLTIASKDYTRSVIQKEYDESVTEYNEKYAEYEAKLAQYNIDKADYEDKLAQYNAGTLKKKPTKPTEPTEPTDTRTVTKAAIDSYFESNYAATRSSVTYGDLWLINVTFESSANATNALKQLGIVVKNNPSGTKDWYWGNDFDNDDDDVILTEDEVITAFINLYNNQNASKDLSNKISLTRTQIDSLLTELAKRYKNEDYDATIFDTLEDKLYYESYSSTYLPKFYYGQASEKDYDFLNTFTPSAYSYNSVYNLTLNLGYIKPSEQTDDINAEILDILLDNQVTDTVVKTKMAALRNENGLIIYDADLEATYVSNFTSDYKTTKKSSKNIIAAMGDIKVTADDLFKTMSERYGVLLTIDTYQKQSMLQSKYNTIYDVVNKKVLDKTAWKEIGQNVQDEKRYLSSGAYSSYGYSATYGWTQFLNDYYGVTSEYELKIVFVYQKAMTEYIKAMSSLDPEVNSDASDLWNNVIVPAMNETYDKYFSLTGVHLLITVMDDSNSPVDPSEWVDEQKVAAKELYDKVLTLLTDEDKNPEGANTSTILSNVASDFALAPKWTVKTDGTFDETSDDALDITYTYDTIDYAKYKSLGLSVKNESLTITPGTMVEDFENATKAIWNYFEGIEDHTEGYKLLTHDFAKSLGLTSENKFYLETEYGYHVYANLTSTARTSTTVDDEKLTLNPRKLGISMADAAKYIADKTDEELTTYQKAVFASYLTPVMTELTETTNGYYYNLTLINDMLDNVANITYANNVNGTPDYINDTILEIILKYYQENYFSSLTYVKEKDTEDATTFEETNEAIIANPTTASATDKAKFMEDYQALSAWTKAALKSATVEVYYTFAKESFTTKHANVYAGTATLEEKVEFLIDIKTLDEELYAKLDAVQIKTVTDAVKAEGTNFTTTYETSISTFNSTAYTSIVLADAITYVKAYNLLSEFSNYLTLDDNAKSAYTKAKNAIGYAADKFEEDDYTEETNNFFELIDAVAKNRYEVDKISNELKAKLADFVATYEAFDDLVKEELSDRTVAVYDAVKAYIA